MSNSKPNWLTEEPGCGELLARGFRGIEKESLRVLGDGRIAKSLHPAAFGSPLTHPYLTTDYSEALLEFVTPPFETNWESLNFLVELHQFTHAGLVDEWLWPASMPCIVAANEDIPIARYGASNAGMMRTVYRRGLGYRYGRAMQAIAGVHFNYSPPEAFWPAYYDFEGGRGDPRDFKSEKLMGLVRNYRRCAWLVAYLFGGSPALCKSFRPEGHESLEQWDAATWYAPHATSLRMSDMGYRNKSQARLNVSSNSLRDYVAGLESALRTPHPRYEEIGVVANGEFRQLSANILQIENEYYSSIRPKPAAGHGKRAAVSLAENGVEYVEIRTLDLSIDDPVGIGQKQMRFLEALLLSSLLSDSPPIDADEQQQIDERDLRVARLGRQPGLRLSRGGDEVSLMDWGMELLDSVEPVAEILDADGEGYCAAVVAARDCLRDPEQTPSARLLRDLRETGTGFAEYGMLTARRHREYFESLPIDEAAQARLAEAARGSRAEALSLERAETQAFDEYLREYFAFG